MSTFLFDEIIFGPVFSRRLGISLGINLLPSEKKFCNFNCIYCECGLGETNQQISDNKIPSFEQFKTALETRLTEMSAKGKPLNAITFAGNGEPTLHPQFAEIIDETLVLRNRYFSEVKIAVLSNSTNLHKENIFNALSKIEMPILKLDSAITETLKLLNSPPENFNVENVIINFLKFNGNFILQTMFLRSNYNGNFIDNTSEKELSAWLNIIKITNPKQVMIYTIARETPVLDLEKISVERLNEIAILVEKLGVKTQVSA